MLGKLVLPELEAWELMGLGCGGSPNSDPEDALVWAEELESDGELGTNGSKRLGGGEDNGEELWCRCV
jgi:hypothetical protein